MRGERPAQARLALPGRPGDARLYALIVPGLHDIARAELTGSAAHSFELLRPRDRREDLLLFRIRDPAAALRCGTLENVFQLVVDAPLAEGRRSLRDAARSLTRAGVEAALTAHRALLPGRRSRSYHVVARMSGRHAFRREDVARAFEHALGSLLSRWAAREPATIELWVHVVGERIVAGMRLSGDELAQRAYKRAHVPASLKPTVARALILLAQPTPGDVFVDPMCGAGTVARERAECGRAKLIAAGDSDARATQAARANAGRALHLASWDATRLPLRDACVDVIATNPPYGRRHAAAGGAPRLYRLALLEYARVLRRGGRCVALTGAPDVLRRALPSTLAVRDQRRLLVRGLSVTAFVIERAGG